MNAYQIENDLTEFTVFNSHFETERNYIGLSKIVESPEELIKLYRNPIAATKEEKIRCYKGYQEEKDVVNRLIALYPNAISYGEISAYDGLVKGHPDCWLYQSPVDVKSFARDDYMPIDRVNKRIFWQMQAYLFYSNSSKGFFICESRESGKIRVLGANPIPAVQKEIDNKIKLVIEMLSVKDNGQRRP